MIGVEGLLALGVQRQTLIVLDILLEALELMAVGQSQHHGGIGVAPEGRSMHLNPSSNSLIGNMCVKLAADNLPEGGDVAILSATATSTNQNTWIEEMKKVLPNYKGINVVDTVPLLAKPT